MNRAILAILSVVSMSSACTTALPVLVPGHDTVLYCEMEEGCEGWALEVAVAFDRYEAMWVDRFGTTPTLPLTLTVRDHIWGGFDWEALDGGRVLGYTNGRDIVMVGRDLDTLEPVNPAGEVLWHEVNHSVLTVMYGNGDGDHHDGEGPWHVEHDEMIRDLVFGVDLVDEE